MKTHRLISTLLILVLAGSAAAQTGFFGDDSRITYVGRTETKDHTVSFDWTGTYLRIAFEGTSLKMRCTDTERDYLNLWIDSEMQAEPDSVLIVEGDTLLTLFATPKRKNKAKYHSVIVQKRTEGEQGRLTIKELIINGELLPAEPVRERLIEFIGDSYTCGYGAENSRSTDHFSPATETAAKTYAAIVSRYFDADYLLVAHSGMGICRNYNSKYSGYYMPQRYLQTYDTDSTVIYNAHKQGLKPSLTVVFLGGNDFSVGVTPEFEDFKRNYILLLQKIKANYGEDHPILCCAKWGNETLQDYVLRSVKGSGLTNISFVAAGNGLFHQDDHNLGADRHPNYEAHRKIAYMLLPYISTATGWELPKDKSLR